MNESIDDLLAEMKAEFQSSPDIKPLPINPTPETEIKSGSTFLKHSHSSSAMADLLSEMKNELATNSSFSPINTTSVKAIQEEFVSLSPGNDQGITGDYNSNNATVNLAWAGTNHLLNNLKSELIQEQEKALEAQRKQEELKLEEEKRQAQLKRERKRQALLSQAKEWLKNLNPKSDEGIWFEEFSYGYENKLDAAIDYLEALREVKF